MMKTQTIKNETVQVVRMGADVVHVGRSSDGRISLTMRFGVYGRYATVGGERSEVDALIEALRSAII